MTVEEYHMVEFRDVASGQIKKVRGAKKTPAELQAEAEAAEGGAALVVRMVAGLPSAAGSAVMLCDGAGSVLPCQERVVLEQSADGVRVTATFFVDGQSVVMA